MLCIVSSKSSGIKLRLDRFASTDSSALHRLFKFGHGRSEARAGLRFASESSDSNALHRLFGYAALRLPVLRLRLLIVEGRRRRGEYYSRVRGSIVPPPTPSLRVAVCSSLREQA